MTVADGLWLWADDIDFTMIYKIYGTGMRNESADATYSPSVCTGIDIRVISGNPDLSRVSTSNVERQNLPMRTGMGCFTRLTNGFIKKCRASRSRGESQLRVLQLRTSPPESAC